MAVEREVEGYVGRLRALAAAEPALLATLMEDWLLADGPQLGSEASFGNIPQAQVQSPDMTNDDFEDLGFEDEFFDDKETEDLG